VADQFVRQLGAVTDIDGIPLPVGVDYDCVSIGNVRLSSGLAEEFARLFMHACWVAGAQSMAVAEQQRLEDNYERVMSLGGDN
jgi:hypothetical protein